MENRTWIALMIGLNLLAVLKTNCLPRTGYSQSIDHGMSHEEAAFLTEAMDTTVDPCQDFFQYACGGWLKKNPLPPSKSRWSQIEVMREQLVEELKIILENEVDSSDSKTLNSARIMYKACMDTRAIRAAGLKPLTDSLDKFGGWPMVSGHSVQEINFDWKYVTGSIRSLYRVSYLLSIYNDLDSYDTNRSSIYIDQGSLSLPRSILLNRKDNSKVITAYTNYITGAAKLVRDSMGKGDGASDEQINLDAQELLQFEIELAKITTPAEARRNNTRMYNAMRLTDLQTWTDSFNVNNPQARMDWIKYLNTIYRVANVEIKTNERVVVVEIDYIRNLFTLLDRTPMRTVANYIMWRLVRLLSPGTTDEMNNLAINFSKALYGNPQSEPRSNSCANEINSLLGYAISAKYIENSFDEKAKVQVESMITYLKTAFIKLIGETDWMDPLTKMIARGKVNAMIALVGYPDWIKNKQFIESYYDGIVVSETDHFANVDNISALLIKKDLSSLRRSGNRNRWITFPSVVNAFYAPKYNSISFPAGILKPPYYGLTSRSAAMNFGGIGVVIGHEITHGFDDRGRQNDKYGNLSPWWTESTLENYLSRTQCFIDKFNNYRVLNGTRLNGATTLGENMADYGGIREAFQAYQSYVATNGEEQPVPGLEQFTPEQIFFLTFANTHCGGETPEKLLNQIMTDPHSPNRYRVIGTLSNSEDFVRVFKCPPQSPMNQLNKCLLWR